MDLAKSSSGAGFLPTEDADSAKKELLVARNVLEIGAKVRVTFVYRQGCMFTLRLGIASGVSKGPVCVKKWQNEK